MKNGEIKSSGSPTAEELEQINKHTRREMKPEEVYSFSVVLCDNDLDRDFEYFTLESLNKMAELFVGKTGISDHSHRSSDQCARIYFCEVITDDTRKNHYGEPYSYIKAKAYMPITEKTKDLITEIDAGIKKEVSVGCAVAKKECSVCGGNPSVCGHKKGRYYQKNGVKTLCSHALQNPYDAYEWSFVAVPAQRKAGVTKSLNLNGESFDEILKSLKTGDITLDKSSAASLTRYIEQLTEKVKAAEEYMLLQKKAAIGSICAALTQEQAAVVKKAVDRMSPHEIFSLYRSSLEEKDEGAPQLFKQKQKTNINKNKEFII